MTNAIQDAIARATAAAAEHQAAPPAAAPSLPATAPSAGVPAGLPAGRPRSLADAMASAGAAVDHWLQVKEFGLTIDKGADLLETIPVTIRLSELKLGYGCRYSVGSQVQYAKSYDGLREVKSGQPWQAVLAEAMRTDPKCRGSYELAEIPMALLGDVDLKKAKTKVEAGKRLGYTTSVTGYALFMQWVSQVAPVYGEHADIPVELGWTTKKGPTGPYGLVTFTTATQQ